MSIVRFMGPLGKPFTSFIVRKRISWMPEVRGARGGGERGQTRQIDR